MLVLIYTFVIFVVLIPVAHWVLLTVNEEFFVFASFFIFVDLFGLMFANLISDSLSPMQQRIALRFRNVLETDLAMQANVHASYIQLAQFINVAKGIRKQFYEELHNLIKQRKMDIKLFTIQLRTIAYRIVQLYELDLDRFTSYLTGSDQMLDLHNSLDQLPTGVNAVSQDLSLTNLDHAVQLVINFDN